MTTTPKNESTTNVTENGKKPWQTLEIKALDVPTNTAGGTFRLDPVEDFFAYRVS